MNKLKKIELIELNEAYQKVLIWFFSFPDIEIGLNDLSEALKISKTTAKRVVNQLIEEELPNYRQRRLVIYNNQLFYKCICDIR